MINKQTIIFLLTVLMLSSFAFAQSSSVSSVTTTTSTTTVTTGTNVLLTSTSTANSDTVSNVQIQLVKDSGTGDFTISDPGSPYYYTSSVSTSGTAKTFTFTAGTSGSYTYHVVASWSGGSKSSTSSSIEFVSPSSMQITGTPSTASKSKGQTFDLTVSVQNPTASTVTTSYALSLPTQFTAAGDPTSSSGFNVTAGSTKAFTWTVTEATAYSGTKAINFQLGDNAAAFTVNVTNVATCSDSVQNGAETGVDCGGSCTACSTSSGTTGSTSTSTTTTTAVVVNQTQTIANITAGSIIGVNFTKSELSVSQVTLDVKNTVNDVKISIKEAAKPSGAEEPVSNGVVYKYIDITKENIQDTDLNSVKIKFNIPKSWVTSNNINMSTIALIRYNNGWTKLVTTKMDETSDSIVYEAESPGFSVFAVAGEKNIEAQPVVTPTPTPIPPVTIGDNTIKVIIDYSWLILIFVVAIIVVAGYIHYHGKPVYDFQKSRKK